MADIACDISCIPLTCCSRVFIAHFNPGNPCCFKRNMQHTGVLMITACSAWVHVRLGLAIALDISQHLISEVGLKRPRLKALKPFLPNLTYSDDLMSRFLMTWSWLLFSLLKVDKVTSFMLHVINLFPVLGTCLPVQTMTDGQLTFYH